MVSSFEARGARGGGGGGGGGEGEGGGGGGGRGGGLEGGLMSVVRGEPQSAISVSNVTADVTLSFHKYNSRFGEHAVPEHF